MSKRYGNKVAVDRITLQVAKGSIFGLLGPNGAGKTSLIRMITTITRPDSGSILLDGVPLHRDHPREIGYLPEERGLYKKMKVGEHLLYLGQLKGLDKKTATANAKEWLERLELTERWSQPVEALSKGLQQQVQFVSTVIHEPQLLILDEPFSGLDPINTNRLKDEILRLHEAGTSIIFSTHRMEQVEEICQFIALINAGQKVLEGEVAEVRERYKKHHFQLDYRGELPAGFSQQFTLVNQTKQSIVLAAPEQTTANDILPKLLATGVRIQAFSELLPSLNDIFIQIVNHPATASTNA